MASFDRSYRAERSPVRQRDLDPVRQRDPDRRRRLEPELHHLETHFHSLLEQQAITRGLSLIHDVELERRQGAGHFHRESPL